MLTAAAARARPWAKSGYSVSGAYIGAGPDQKVLTAFRVLTTPDRPCSVPGAYNARPAVQRSGCLQRPTGRAAFRVLATLDRPLLTPSGLVAMGSNVDPPVAAAQQTQSMPTRRQGGLPPR
jgi:hypothetical protein